MAFRLSFPEVFSLVIALFRSKTTLIRACFAGSGPEG
jgi:hypothetical protein